jgi:hypothetical protein
VFSTSLRAIVLKDHMPKLTATQARMNGHAKPAFADEKHVDLALLAQRLEDGIHVQTESARYLRALNRRRAEIRDVQEKAAKYDEMVIALSKSEQENADLKRQVGEMEARLSLIRVASHDLLNEKCNATQFGHIVIEDILDIRHSGGTA